MSEAAKTAPPVEAVLAEIREVVEASEPQDPWFLSDCEGELNLWRESVLTHVSRDAGGTIVGYSEPSAYRSSDLVASWELDSWDPEEDTEDDRSRAAARFMASAHRNMPRLLKAVEATLAKHAPYRIYEPCGHDHTEGEPGVVEVSDVGLVCPDGFVCTICLECCTGGSGYQSEECVSSHKRSCWPCPTQEAVTDALGTGQ